MRGSTTRGNFAAPGLGFEWVPRTDVAKTRPALERAKYRCECCPRDDGLRVVQGREGELAVLCPECAVTGGLQLVLARRRAVDGGRSIL